MGLILVDSGVWVDLLADRHTPQVDRLRSLLNERNQLAIGDLVLAEVLQGARYARQLVEARCLLESFHPVVIGDHRVAVAAATHYRHLRSLGITPRKTIDTLIATRCILDRLPLLYSDRDFDPFVQHLGLRSAMDLPTGA